MAKSARTNKPPIKKKYIEHPDILWELFLAYVAHEQAHPMHKVEYVGKDGRKEKTPLEVPITFDGFECYLWDQGIICNLSNYETNKDGSYDSYQPIISRIKKNCFTHNFKGAAVGLFNANLIARKLGIKDNQDNTIANPDGTPIKVTLKL